MGILNVFTLRAFHVGASAAVISGEAGFENQRELVLSLTRSVSVMESCKLVNADL